MSVTGVVKAAASAPANGRKNSDTPTLIPNGTTASFTGSSVGMASNVDAKMTVTPGSAGAYVSVDGGTPVLLTYGAGATQYTGLTVYAEDAAEGSGGGGPGPPPPPNL